MKKQLLILCVAFLLGGCKGEETFETVEDMIPDQPVAAVQQFFVSMPQDATAPTFQNPDGEIYFCTDYTISKQILEGGDMEKTIQTITGKNAEELELLKTQYETHDRYDFVWAAVGEEGLQLGRACILDDGNYHYTLTAMTGESQSQSTQEQIREMFASCKLLEEDVNLHTGS